MERLFYHHFTSFCLTINGLALNFVFSYIIIAILAFIRLVVSYCSSLYSFVLGTAHK